MPRLHIERSVAVERTIRGMQLEGLFDVPPSERAAESWDVDLPIDDFEWSVGLISGPSGSGKTTIANEFFPGKIVGNWDWPENAPVVDGFPDMSIKEITMLLSSVGFSSPPSWLKPFRVLSNGEQWRATMARILAEMPEFAVIDEFSSVVDRTVAKIGSAAIAKTVRRRGNKVICISCHYDIAEWLEPDWIYDPSSNHFARGDLQRPPIALEIYRVHPDAWHLFRKHHYLNTNLNHAAICFVAFFEGRPAAFTSWLHFVHHQIKDAKRAHRTVCLPDFQGVGIGNALNTYTASLWKAVGFRALSTTSHPAMIGTRNRSPNWKMTKIPHFNSAGGTFAKDKYLGKSFAKDRWTASFEYVGPALDYDEARALVGDVKMLR